MRVNRKVSIWKHVRLADGKWRCCRPVLDAKGQIIPYMVLVNGREVRYDEGTYVISFYNPTLTWQKCGPKPADAVAAAERQRALLKAMEPSKPLTWHYTHSHWERRGGKWLMTMFQDSTAKD